MFPLSPMGFASKIFNNSLASMKLKGQGPMNDLLAPPKCASAFLGCTEQLLLQEGDEKGLLFRTLLKGFECFQAHSYEVIVIFWILRPPKKKKKKKKNNRRKNKNHDLDVVFLFLLFGLSCFLS